MLSLLCLHRADGSVSYSISFSPSVVSYIFVLIPGRQNAQVDSRLTYVATCKKYLDMNSVLYFY